MKDEVKEREINGGGIEPELKEEGCVDADFDSSEKDDLDELKQAAGQFAKAAGGVVGSFGKFALKKGEELKEKLEDEEFQEKTKASIKAATERVTESATKVAEKATTVVENTSSRLEKEIEHSDEKIKLYEEKKPKKKSKRELKREKEKKESTMVLLVCMLVVVACFAFLISQSKNEETKEKEKIYMQSVVGQTVGEATATLENVGVKKDCIVYYDVDGNDKQISNPETTWIVIKQNPDEGTEVGTDTEIKLSIQDSKAKEESNKDKETLKSFVGTTCYESDSLIVDMGYTPTYLASNTKADMTGDIQYFEETAQTFTITKMSQFNYKKKTVTYIVQSEWMKENEEANSAAKSAMKDYEAISAVNQYGKEQFGDSFELKQIQTSAEVIEGRWAVLGPCTYKNVYGTKVTAECVARVSGTSAHRVVEEFEVR